MLRVLHFLPVHAPQLPGDTHVFPQQCSVAIVRSDFRHHFLTSQDVVLLLLG